jgi:predicted regulator of Ras-like GTPase activity (Roadblock/LC7/MglB family)
MTAGDGAADALARFVRDAGVQLALLMHADGRVIAQQGFTHRVDVATASVLAAAIQSSTRELRRFVGDSTLGPVHHAGGERQLFLAPVPEGEPERLVLVVFDRSSSLGLVRVFWEELVSALRRDRAAPAPRPEHFERDLQDSLAALFGEA